jgi:hypothetical protein
MTTNKDIKELSEAVDRLIDKKNIGINGLLAIVNFDLLKETGYDDNLAKALAYTRLKAIAVDALDKIQKA